MKTKAEATAIYLKAVEDILTERSRQDAKFGEQNHSPADWMMILQEELGEFARAHMKVYYFATPEPGMTAEQRAAMRASFNAKRAHLRAELVQVAAVALAMLECCDRNKWSGE